MRDPGSLSQARQSCRVGVVILSLFGPWTAACRERAQPPDSLAAASTPAAPARTIRVGDDVVVIEGRWQSVDAGGAPVPLSAVRATCLKAPRSCREELTEPAARGSSEAAPPHVLDYQVREWTKWKIVAVHKGGQGDNIELHISPIGLAAERLSTARAGQGGTAGHWRLE